MQKRMVRNMKGFAAASLILVLLLVGVVGFAGWFIYQNNLESPKDSQVTTQEDSVPSSASVPIKSSADIDSAISELESTPVDDDLDTTQIDEDINSVL